MNAINWKIPKDLLAASIQMMRPHGSRGNEGLALWLGRQKSANTVEITHAVEAYGSGFSTSPLHLGLSLRAMTSLLDLADSLGRYLVGQIHSHPGQYIDLSDLDRAQGIRVPNYLSVVCPYYAQREMTVMSQCGVHVFEGSEYRWVPCAEAARRLTISDQPVVRIRQEVQRD
jgi:hypothetical protein